MIKPLRPLLLLIYIAVFLAIVLTILPPEIRIYDALTFRSFSLKSLIEKPKDTYVDISAITSQLPTADSLVTQAPATEKIDTQKTVLDTVKALNLPVESQYRLQFPEEDTTVMNNFFSALREASGNQLIRVLHYGDSQIEGDRISSYLRSRLQQRFGGCGVGLVPLLDVVGSRMSIAQYSDPEWQKLFVYSNGYKKADADSYGVMGAVFRYSSTNRVAKNEYFAMKIDTIRDTSQHAIYVPRKDPGILVSYAELKRGYPKDKQAQVLKLLYRNPQAPFQVTIQEGFDSTQHARLDTSSQFHIYSHRLKKDFDKLTLTFRGTPSPDLYAACLDCEKGVAVDNIPFRGSSGVDFTRMNKSLLGAQIKALNVRMIILQFGVNIVPYVQKDYSWYEQSLSRQLKLFKELAPNASILVIGVSDMSHRAGESYVSYPNIEKIRDAQRKAAFKAGCAFWDTYVAMGGQNSMPSWVFAKPALAKHDFIHFTPKGAMIISEMLYKALIREYELYRASVSTVVQ
ncbi:GDSL-type esterase/lipase family protein [Cytophagaceae bacterium DM2B3-1]|uniref:GDSL-type esterase/lipase family protein n=1 Tax=Xanthocytophaga flava TaxID=3048013 RepID=A0ABT7CDF2_9BACT|nr:GDSL-type esterase/lipase family protein [Xanthocytophaga flavus]MDJ1473442.1 GDSL-type esterase/lipase family protein [Xanthocytophaga flavus]MDJ1491652.1 GDSL-type esterase/lipase family protein [Xanthocytophaga flavus]